MTNNSCFCRNVFLLGAATPGRRGVAFFVGLTNNIGPISQHADIVFDRVVTNVGDAYDEETGRFTASVNGTYQFNVIIAAQGRQKVRLATANRSITVSIRFAAFVVQRLLFRSTTGKQKMIRPSRTIINEVLKSDICANRASNRGCFIIKS